MALWLKFVDAALAYANEQKKKRESGSLNVVFSVFLNSVKNERAPQTLSQLLLHQATRRGRCCVLTLRWRTKMGRGRQSVGLVGSEQKPLAPPCAPCANAWC
jgi:hypothetical protein